MSKKHITAPLSYDPGKGRPKEYLAYLNWQEMQALQRLNGGNMERGPRGLPSFPPDDAIGSSQNAATGNWTGSPGGTTTGTSSTGTTSTGSSNYGTDPSSWSGSGTNYSGTSASTSSTATSSTTSSAASTTSAASQNTTDEAAQQAAAVNNAVEAAKNAALNEDARRAGIGSIDIGPQRTPVNIGGGAISAAVQSGIQQSYASTPVTQSSLASTGYYHSFSDALPGMNSPTTFSRTISPSNLVNEYGTPMETWSNSYNPNVLTEGAKKIHQAIADQSLRMNVPVDYFSGKRGYNPRTGTQQHPAGQAIDIRINDPVTGRPVGYQDIGNFAYNPIGSIAKDKNGNYIRSPAQAARIQEALAGPYRQFATGVMGSFISNPGVYGEFNNQRWGGAFQEGRYSKDYMHFDEGKASAGVSADQARLREEAIAMASDPSSYAAYKPYELGSPSYESMYAAAGVDATPASTQLAKTENTYNPGVIADPIATIAVGALTRLPSTLSSFKIPAISEVSTFEKMKRAAASTIDPVKFQQEVNQRMADLTSGFSLPTAISSGISALNQYAAPKTTTATSATPADANIATVEDQYRDPFAKPGATTQNYKLFDEAQTYPKYVTPERQALIEDQERKNRIGIKIIERAPFVGPVTGAVEGITKLFTGEDIADQATQKKYAFEQMSPEQQAAAMAKDPSLRRYAVSAGIIPPSGGSQYAYSGGTPTRELGGKDSPTMLYLYGRPNYSDRYTSYQSEADDDKSALRKQYRLWDMGIGIPEPGDPDYNDYMKYLESRGTSAQV